MCYSVITFSFNEMVIRTRFSYRISFYCNPETNVYHTLVDKEIHLLSEQSTIYNDDLSGYYDIYLMVPNVIYPPVGRISICFTTSLERYPVLRLIGHFSVQTQLTYLAYIYNISLTFTHYRDVSLGTILRNIRTKMNMSPKCNQYTD